MNIIIVGAGKVGITIGEQLSSENHNITIIDLNQKKVEEAEEKFDVMGVVGNGASYQVQMEAGVMDAELLIAVTGADELNLLCCLIAKKAGKCQTIARVRNPIYSKEVNFIKRQMGLSVVINPELAAAQEISKLLRFPSAIKIDTFARGKVELLKFKVMPEFELDGKSIQQITEHFRCDILFCAIEGKDYTTIPGGTNVIRNGDVISILATPQNAAAFFKKIGLKTHQVKNTVIVGGGTISYYLAKALLAMKIKVKVIEKDKNRCEFLSEELTDATIINGDGTDRSLLLEEGLESAESFVTLTNMDEENIFLSLFAKTISNAKLVAKVNRLAYDDIIDSLDIGSVIYPKYITADYILQYVRATQNSIGSNVETLYHILDGKAEALEFKICDNSPIVGRTLSELNLKKNLLVGCLYRDGSVRIPRGHDALEIGDRVVIVTTNRGLRDINDILAK